jgi:hypothetical protein
MSALPPSPHTGAVSASGAADRTATGDPFSPGLRRAAAATGILAAVLLVLSVAVNASDVPDFLAPAGEYAAYAREHESDLKLGGLLLLLSSFALVFYAGVIRSALGESETAARGFVRLGYVVLAGLTFGATCFALGATTQAVVGGLGDGGEPEVAKTLTLLGGALVAAGMMGFAAALDAAGFIILRTRAFPAWLGWLALVSAVFFLLTAFYVLDPSDDENVFGAFFPLAFLTFLVWLVATSVTLIGRAGRDR